MSIEDRNFHPIPETFTHDIDGPVVRKVTNGSSFVHLPSVTFFNISCALNSRVQIVGQITTNGPIIHGKEKWFLHHYLSTFLPFCNGQFERLDKYMSVSDIVNQLVSRQFAHLRNIILATY